MRRLLPRGELAGEEGDRAIEDGNREEREGIPRKDGKSPIHYCYTNKIGEFFDSFLGRANTPSSFYFEKRKRNAFLQFRSLVPPLFYDSRLPRDQRSNYEQFPLSHQIFSSFVGRFKKSNLAFQKTNVKRANRLSLLGEDTHVTGEPELFALCFRNKCVLYIYPIPSLCAGLLRGWRQVDKAEK